MKEVINWLLEVEELARRVYEKAASRFPNDKELSDFLRHLSSDEKMHYDIAVRAVELARDSPFPPLAIDVIDVNDDVRKKIVNYLLLAEKKLEANSLTMEDIIDCVVSTEFSEWNDIFLYVTNSLKHKYREFTPVVTKTHQHKRYIERFLESHHEFKHYLEKIITLPKIWEEKILVVDDETVIADLLVAIFADEGVVDTAVNGKDALKKVDENYYAAIVTDVDMPVMNGMEFYKKAAEKHHDIKERFLFFTGLLNEERLSFFKRNSLRYIAKPAKISDIKKELVAILSR